MRRILKIFVVLAGSLPVVYLVLMILARLNVPRVTEASNWVLRLDPSAVLDGFLRLISNHAVTVELPAVDYMALIKLFLRLALPAGLAGLVAMTIPALRKRREGVRHGYQPSLRERFSEWRAERRAQIDARRGREEEAEAAEEQRKTLERKRRDGLTIRDLLHPEELPS